jgi:cytoskeletal protein CcmA (bactofilin family)
MKGLFKNPAGHLLDASKVETLIGAEATVQGVVSLKGSLRVDGRVEGSISDAQTVVVGSGGVVRGDISAESVVVGGRVVGNISATESVEILPQGRVRGDLRSPRLVIEEGGRLNGQCSMDGGEAAEEDLEAVENDR